MKTAMSMTAKNSLRRGCILTLFGGILWGASGTCGQYLLQVKGLTSDWLVPIRLLTAGLLLLVVCYFKEGKQIFALWRVPKDGRDILIFGMVGMSMCQYTYFTAIGHSNAGTATVLQYIGPVLIMLYVSLRTGKMPEKSELAAVALALFGTYLLATHGNMNSLAISSRALFWGLCSAAALAVYTVQPGRLLDKYGSMAVTAWGMFIGGVLLCLIRKPWNIKADVDGVVICGMAVIILAGTIIAFTSYMEGVKCVGPEKGSLFAAIEPVSATVFSVLFMKAGFGPMDLLGFVCIISTIFLLALGKSR
ncbi:DMT family transporter [Clostridium sp. Marseille-P2415]|uniref:DMT family transporter n=1 Tax=Clostridium sp. Marseille-P2415 TaxID=1805471 RepID=UPI001F16E200|nr:DMT family transporter [Clostridium sp. Marseille-P2415]